MRVRSSVSARRHGTAFSILIPLRAEAADSAAVEQYQATA
jgi:hypothetical protein